MYNDIDKKIMIITNLMEKDYLTASKLIEKNYSKLLQIKGEFVRIYPFATENIAGYIDSFNLKNKSLLTIGSSASHSISASLYGCLDQTIYDICPFTKEYFNLVKSALLSLSYLEFLNFLRYIDYPEVSINNKLVFNKDLYLKYKQP